MSTVPAGYKQTEVGVIPEEWEVKTLQEITKSFQLGGNYPNSLIESPYPLIKMGNIGRGNINLNKIEYIIRGTIPAESDRLNCGDVILNTRNTLELVGKTAIWNDELLEAYFNSNILRFNFNTAFVSSSFCIGHLLNTKKSLAEIKNIAFGTTSVAAIYARDLKNVPLPLPPLPEQKRIAQVLGDVDVLIQKLEALIAKKRDIKQAAMQELLTGKRRLPGFSGAWETKKLGEIAALRSERVDPRSFFEPQVCIELENLEGGSGRLVSENTATVASSLKTAFQAGDVLFGKLRAYLRKYWKADKAGICSTEIWAIFSLGNQIQSGFLYYCVQSDKFIDAACESYGTHMPRSDWKVVRNYSLSLPPLPEQTAIAQVLSDMDTELAQLESRLGKTRDLKAGLMQQLLTGKIRLEVKE